MAVNQTNQLRVVPVAGRVGAEIQGVKLSKDIEQGILNEIKQLLSQYKVLFFKGQHHLVDQEHTEFAKLFGELYAHPTLSDDAEEDVILELNSQLGGKVNHWHTDVSFTPEVPKYSILRGVKIPKVGGDTLWANTNTAYEDLPEGLKNIADGLWATHTNDYDYAKLNNLEGENIEEPRKELKKRFESSVYKTKHPVVHIHAETGKKHLLLGAFAGKLDGYTTSESEKLISIFQSYVTSPENTVRWKWSEGDIVIWDNLATQHYAVADYDEHRIVRRITAGKVKPVNEQNEAGLLISKK